MYPPIYTGSVTHSDPSVQQIHILITERLKAILLQCLADPFQQCVIKIEIMHDAQAHGKHLLTFEEMADIST